MSVTNRSRLAILHPGDRSARDRSDPAESRSAGLLEAFFAAGVAAVPVIYNDDFADEVQRQLEQVRGETSLHEIS